MGPRHFHSPEVGSPQMSTPQQRGPQAYSVTDGRENGTTSRRNKRTVPITHSDFLRLDKESLEATMAEWLLRWLP